MKTEDGAIELTAGQFVGILFGAGFLTGIGFHTLICKL